MLLNEQIEISGDLLLDQYSPTQYSPANPAVPLPLDGQGALPFNGQPGALLLNAVYGYSPTMAVGGNAEAETVPSAEHQLNFPLPYVTPSSAEDVAPVSPPVAPPGPVRV